MASDTLAPGAGTRPDFVPLPPFRARSGADRRVGIEVEFGGLTERAAARVARDAMGGDLSGVGGRAVVRHTCIGRIETYLDTSLRDRIAEAFGEKGLSWGRTVIPVELVTEPLRQADLPQAEALIAHLAAAGATGTQSGMLLGFGLHLNVEMADPDGADIPAVGTAFAFVEQWLRDRDPIDISRRLLPFVDRHPGSYLDALATAPHPLPLGAFRDLYFEYNPSRNRGLDLHPVLAHLFPNRPRQTDAVRRSRPAYHYRLPDSRLGDPAWSLAYEWRRWAFIERIARDDDLLAALRTAWLRRGWIGSRNFGAWSATVDACLAKAGLSPDAP